jgi:alpha-amylase
VINIFPDYETFGEHHWPETGIHEFLKHLPEEVLKWLHLRMTTPSQVVEKYAPVGDVDVPEVGGTVSWADLERDASCWLGNTMQWAYYTRLRKLEPIVRETGEQGFMKLWRYMQTSDHLYYMFTAGGAPGEVHSYFSSFNTPTDAFVTAQAVILDFENRVRLSAIAANEPFLFYTGEDERHFTGERAWTLKGLSESLRKVCVKSIEFHNTRGDFEKWAEESLQDQTLARQMKKVRVSRLKGEALQRELRRVTEKRFRQLTQDTQKATRYF